MHRQNLNRSWERSRSPIRRSCSPISSPITPGLDLSPVSTTHSSKERYSKLIMRKKAPLYVRAILNSLPYRSRKHAMSWLHHVTIRMYIDARWENKLHTNYVGISSKFFLSFTVTTIPVSTHQGLVKFKFKKFFTVVDICLIKSMRYN